MSAASNACQQLVQHVSSEESMSAASKACQQLVKHVSSLLGPAIGSIALQQPRRVRGVQEACNTPARLLLCAHTDTTGVPERGSIAISGSTKSISPTCTSGLVSAGAG